MDLLPEAPSGIMLALARTLRIQKVGSGLIDPAGTPVLAALDGATSRLLIRPLSRLLRFMVAVFSIAAKGNSRGIVSKP